MAVKKTILTAAIAITALFGVVSPVHASEASPEHFRISVASGGVLEASSGIHGFSDAGGTIADAEKVHVVKDAGGRLGASSVHTVDAAGGKLADCGTAICNGVGASANWDSVHSIHDASETLGGQTSGHHEVTASGGAVADADAEVSHR